MKGAGMSESTKKEEWNAKPSLQGDKWLIWIDLLERFRMAFLGSIIFVKPYFLHLVSSSWGVFFSALAQIKSCMFFTLKKLKIVS